MFAGWKRRVYIRNEIYELRKGTRNFVVKKQKLHGSHANHLLFMIAARLNFLQLTIGIFLLNDRCTTLGRANISLDTLLNFRD